MSSFQGVGIEELHCIQRCPHFRRLEEVPLYTEVSPFQEVSVCVHACVSMRVCGTEVWNQSLTLTGH